MESADSEELYADKLHESEETILPVFQGTLISQSPREGSCQRLGKEQREQYLEQM